MKNTDFSVTLRFLILKPGIFQSRQEAARYLGSYTTEKFRPKCGSIDVHGDNFKCDLTERYKYLCFILFGAFALISLTTAIMKENVGMNEIVYICIIGLSFISAVFGFYFMHRFWQARSHEYLIYHSETLSLEFTISESNIANAIISAQDLQDKVIRFWDREPRMVYSIDYDDWDYSVN